MEENETQEGTVTGIIDSGSIVQVFIETEDGNWPYAADGNLWRQGPGFDIQEGDVVEFSVTDWGGLATIALV